MKRVFLILLILFVSCLNSFSQADDLNKDFEAANQAYATGDFLKASQLYESALKGDSHNWQTYYNLGNCYYKLDMLPFAILNYNRALLLEPGNSDIRYNLEIASTRTTNRIVAIPQFFLVRWIAQVRELFSSNTWGWISICSLTGLLFFVVLFVVSRRAVIRKLTFSFSTVFLFFMIVSMVSAQQQKSMIEDFRGAVVMRNAVPVKSSPSDNGTDLFVLNEGVEVTVVSVLGSWSEVSIASGNKGWLLSDSIEMIKPD